MSQVVNSYIIQTGSGADPSPGALQIGDVLLLFFSDEDVWVFFNAVDVFQYTASGLAQRDCLGAVLVGFVRFEVNEPIRKIDFLPFQLLDFAETGARQD